MRRGLVVSWTQGAVPLLALLMTTCQGNTPSSPSQTGVGTTTVSSGSGSSGGSGGQIGRIEILRAPADGQVFKVTTEGTFPQPAPKFRISITTPTDVPNGYLDIELLNAGSLRCGGVLMTLSGLTAGTAKVMDIANSEIQVGPDSCTYGFNCSRSQCALPLTTKRVRIIVSEDDGELVRTTEDHLYTWELAVP